MKQLEEFIEKVLALPPPVLAGIATATGAVVAAIVTAILAKLILGARDRQDKEAEWRKHAIELAKLDLDRKLKTRLLTDKRPIRPSILDFLANYRDLQELGAKSPRELYETIINQRINPPPVETPADGQSADNQPAKKGFFRRIFTRGYFRS